VADKITKAVLKDSNIAERCKGVGRLSKEEAIRLGAVGPNARASGVPEDTRVMCKYAAYGDFDLEPLTAQGETLLLRQSYAYQRLNNPFGSPKSFSRTYLTDRSKPSTIMK